MLRTNLLIFIYFLVVSTTPGQRINDLDSLGGYKTKVYFSAGNKERAQVVTERIDKVLKFYDKVN